MKRFFKNYGFYLVMLVIFLAGTAAVLYPTISDYHNNKIQSRAIGSYKASIESADVSELQKAKLAADFYNAALYGAQQSGTPLPEGTASYEDILNVDGNGIMGYIVIPYIDIELPIYHGTGNDILQVATGHASTSSVPVGGVNTHSIILGHRGLTTARLFNDLDQLGTDDYFEIHVLGETLYYEVYKVETVLPNELKSLRIVSGEDVVTLVTCTPYGINTHRLLIHGKRIEPEKVPHLISSEARRINRIFVALVLGVVIWLAAMVVLVVYSVKKSSGKLGRDEYLRRRDILRKYNKRYENKR